MWVAVLFLEGEAGLVEGFGIRKALGEIAVEGLHEEAGGAIVDLPIAGDGGVGSGGEEGAGEALDAFTTELGAEAGVAGGEDGELSIG